MTTAEDRKGWTTRLGLGLGLVVPLLAAGSSRGQVVSAPPAVVAQPRNCAAGPGRGALGAKLDHIDFAFHDTIAGWPEFFVEPPLGHYVRQNHALNVSKADPHRSLLYRSDFVGDSATLSPSGAQRLSLMTARLQQCGDRPLLVEWTPENPGLAEARKASVADLCRRAGMPLLAAKVRLSPSPYPGLPGAEAANNNDTLILRNADAARSFSRTPVPQATLIGSGGP